MQTLIIILPIKYSSSNFLSLVFYQTLMILDEKHLSKAPAVITFSYPFHSWASFASPHLLFLRLRGNDVIVLIYLFLVDNNYQQWKKQILKVLKLLKLLKILKILFIPLFPKSGTFKLDLHNLHAHLERGDKDIIYLLILIILIKISYILFAFIIIITIIYSVLWWDILSFIFPSYHGIYCTLYIRQVSNKSGCKLSFSFF